MTSKAEAKRTEGNGYFNKKDYQRAKKAYLEALQIDPLDKASMSNLSVVYYTLQSYDESLQLCDKIISQDRQFKKAYYRKAMCHQKLQQHLDVIQNANKYLQIQSRESITNPDGIQQMKQFIKAAKEKMSQLRSTERVQLNYIKTSTLGALPKNVKDLGGSLGSSVNELRENLQFVMRESLKAYNSEALMELDKLKKSIYRKLLETETDEKKTQIIDILLASNSSREEKDKLLKQKLGLDTTLEGRIETIKQLLELGKSPKLEGQLKQLQTALFQQFKKQYEEERKQENKADPSCQLTEQSTNQKKEENTPQNGVSDSNQSMKQKDLTQPISQVGVQFTQPESQLSQQSFMSKLSKCQKHKNIEQFFQLFKLIGEADAQEQLKIKLLTSLSKSSLGGLYACGASKGQKNYIKKLCKQLDSEYLYSQFKFK